MYVPQEPPDYTELRQSITAQVKDDAVTLALLAVIDRLEALERRYAKHEHKYRTSRGTFDTHPPDAVWA